jgi:hypothetical protein
MRIHLRFLLLLALFVAAVRIHTTNLPVMEGTDEALHYNYAEYLRRENALPNRLERRANGIGQSSGQPPLAGDYPTWAWSSGERLPAVQAAGPAPDNAPVLLPVTIR